MSHIYNIQQVNCFFIKLLYNSIGAIFINYQQPSPKNLAPNWRQIKKHQLKSE